jgi:hypothetical protein
VFGSQESHKLRDLCVGNRVAEGRHLLAAIENLIGNFFGGPELVLAQGGQVGTLFGASAIVAVAVGAAFIAKEDGAGALGVLGV